MGEALVVDQAAREEEKEGGGAQAVEFGAQEKEMQHPHYGDRVGNPFAKKPKHKPAVRLEMAPPSIVLPSFILQRHDGRPNPIGRCGWAGMLSLWSPGSLLAAA